MYRVSRLVRDARLFAGFPSPATARTACRHTNHYCRSGAGENPHTHTDTPTATPDAAASADVSSSPSSSSVSAPPAAAPLRRRPTVADFASRRAPPIVKLAKMKPTPEDTTKISVWDWRKLDGGAKWSHVGRGVFHLVPPLSGDSVGFSLMRGVKSNLFSQPATIHRIIGFEHDLAQEATRDTTHTAEVVLVGRSNVGKSSLLNALLRNGGDRKQLATTSKTPGRTQVLFMFSFMHARDARIVDCPGYGFAKASKAKSQAWNKLMGIYIRKRHRQGILKRVLVLIDIRRGIGPLDEEFMQFLESEQIAYQIVLTKVDSVPPAQFAAQLADVREHLKTMPQGRYGSAAAREAYESRDAEFPDDEQWQSDVNSGDYTESSLMSTDAPTHAYSCSLPIIHAISSRLNLGVTSLQQSLTKMLTMEPNLRKKAYVDVNLDEPMETQIDEYPEDDYPIEDDGMGNEVEEEDAFIPHIPVSHYSPISSDPPSKSKKKKSGGGGIGGRSRSKFGARSSVGGGAAKRGFATSARAPRARSTEKPKKATSGASTKRAKSAPPPPPPSSSPSSSPASSSSAAPAPSASDAHLASIYQKKSQRQHILDRSETYIGSMHHQHSVQWVYHENTAGDHTTAKIVQRECVFVPSLVHIFDEILVNAADNQHRVNTVDGADGTPQVMTSIRVDIDEATGRISICNDGAAIPTVIHPTEGIPIPELIFGHLLTSSNYNDSEQRFTGGRHGYGAKLTNIFSREFTVDIQDVSRRTRFTQTFRHNMSERGEPTFQTFEELEKSGVSKKAMTHNYTRITFVPDFQRFNEKGLTQDTIAIMKKRVYDIAACVNTNIAVAKVTDKRRSVSPSESTTNGVKKIKVYLNSHLLDVDSFPKYLDRFPVATSTAADGTSEPADGKWVFSTVNSNWQVAVGPNVASTVVATSNTNTDAITTPINALPPATRDIAFVNSIYTSRGGTHVNHVADRVTRAIIEHILKSNKKITREMIPASLVKAHMSLLVNCKVPNPSFSSQTKESLMTPVKDFGSECTLSATFINQITANSTGIVPAIVDSVLSRQQIDLLRKSRANAAKRGKALNIPKLDDAHWAGSSDPEKVKQTTLILTEGDSAKALVLSSLAILGRERFGVFPLKGKLLNVRDASLKQVMENAEIQNILAIVGLEIPAKAVGFQERVAQSKPLRYGRIMLMTDQDHDGSHIKGLFLNLLHTYWPELLHGNNFLEEFVTAIIKVRNTQTKVVQSFFTQREFETWKSTLTPELRIDQEKFKRRYHVKYYKGLGTNTNEEGKEYFKNIAKHRVKFVWESELASKESQPAVPQPKQLVENTATGKSAPSLLPSSAADVGAWIRLAFAKDQSDARKEWLQTRYDPSLFVDTSSMRLPIHEFINKELIVFSHADNIRSIPNMFDGLKPVQRKILYGCFKKGLKQEVKVAQLSGYISEQTMYHHGEMSLQGSMINMAQSFIGSNNIALLVGSGQFGSRHTGGKDAAAARYIYTNVSPITRSIFHPHDDPLLSYNDEDGFLVEPNFYMPIIPSVLVNGAEGIGTGFSTFVPTFNPNDLIDNLRRHIAGAAMTRIDPWTRGWHGRTTPNAHADGVITSYTTEGIVEEVSTNIFEVSELPIGRWPDEFKTFLTDLQSDGAIKRFYDQSTDERILFRIEMTNDQAEHACDTGYIKFFKLSSNISMNNMHLFDGHSVMRKYRSVNEILVDFATVRGEYYRRRREHLLIALEVDMKRVENKSRFIRAVTENELTLYNKKKSQLIQELRKVGFATEQELLPQFPIYADHTGSKPIKYTNDVALPADAPLDNDSYDYLLNLPLSTLTAERLTALQADRDSTAAQLATLKKATPNALWLHDLDKLQEQWNELERKQATSAPTQTRSKATTTKRNSTKKNSKK